VKYDSTLDFVQRTRDNVVAVEAWQRGHNHPSFYEVTFLINSLFGLIIVPQTTLFNEIARYVTAVEPRGIPEWNLKFHLSPGELEVPTTIRQLMRGLRNAVAHYRLSFLTQKNEIVGITFEAPAGRAANSPINWRAEFDLDAVRAFALRLADELEKASYRLAA
jgi:hypothetical protein